MDDDLKGMQCISKKMLEITIPLAISYYFYALDLKAEHAAVGQARRATIWYLVYKQSGNVSKFKIFVVSI